ncbi:MAG TPA: polysaccharide deacetylase family protein [Pseudonocardia sp.]|uniref:polysaccharide deacetylase family protein n=1 Tax=Pseudonocardia sp. TaxID=60912 RepID=UPI002F3FD641
MTENTVPHDESAIPRRTLLRGGAAAGALFGLLGAAACSAAQPPTPAAPPPRPPAGPAPAPAAAPPAGPAAPALGAPGPPSVELVRANTGRPEVSLTFHGAGDRTLDRKVLEALANGGAHVTVLAVGTWLAEYPDAAKMVTDLGHELGNHTWSHKTMTKLPVAGQRDEIERCRDRIDQLTGGPGAWFRQSAAQHSTAELRTLAGAAGYPRVLSYDLDSLDWTDPGPNTVRAQLRKAKAGSVVSMHLGHQGTLTAIPQILADLKERGLRPVTATQLFA